jgi:MtrB/PioB family decaheme-associated outer membrane protein
MRIQCPARWLVAGVLLTLGTLTWAPPASGQLSPGDFKFGDFRLEGDVEAGARAFIDRPSPTRRGKFEEYRDINQGVFLNDFYLRFFRSDESYSVSFGGSKWGLDDQEYFLRAGRLGLWEFSFAWDQTPHLLSTTARMRAVEVSPGEWRLPARPDATAISPAEGALYNAAPELDEVGVRWDTARIALLLTPRPDLDFRADYARIHKHGTRPFGVAMGSPGGDFIEVLEPIDHTVHDFRLRGTIARETWQLQAGYIFSRFDNANQRVIADNPLRATFAAFAPSASGGSSSPAFGQASLAPDNMAHTIQISGGVDLPWRTRLSAGFSYSLRLQNDDFLPHTVNPTMPTALLDLPQDSLEGIAGITALNLSLVNRVIPRTTLTLRYRFFNHHEMTDEVEFPGHVVNDQGLSNEPRQTSAFGYSRHNLDLDAKYRPISSLATTLGVGWERWNRDSDHREVPTSDEYFFKAAVDWTPLEWFLAQLTYKPSWRRISEYNTFAHIAHTVQEEELPAAEQAQSQSLLLRKFDEGERDRQQLDLALQFTPLETVTLTLNGMWRNDNYLGGQFGLRDATTWSAGFDVSWSPVERLALFGGYVYEYILQKWNSRNRDVSSGVVSDFEDWNWISVALDRVQTAHIGAKFAITNKLDWTIQASWAYALGEVDNRNETAPLTHPPEFTSTTNATARRQPSFEDSLIRLDTSLRYWITKQWAVSVGYAFESFNKRDYRTDGLNPFMPGSNSIYLGNDSRNYTAHMVGATVRYAFK